MASEILGLLMGTTFLLFFGLLAFIIYRLFCSIIALDDVTMAYKLYRLKEEIKKKGIDFGEMMKDYYESITLFKLSKKGKLDAIDDWVTGVVDEEPKEKPKAQK